MPLLVVAGPWTEVVVPLPAVMVPGMRVDVCDFSALGKRCACSYCGCALIKCGHFCPGAGLI